MLLRRLVLCLALLVGALVSSPAFAQTVSGGAVQPWKTTFQPDAVNSYATKAGLKYVIVAAGEATESTEEAAEALADALREGSAEIVMNDDPLGEVKGLDDDKILDKAKVLPIDRVAIVRVFPGGEGKPDTVVVTVRDKAGEALWALSGTSGKPVEAKASEAGGMGVSRNAAEAVGEVTKTETKATDEAREEYAKRFVWFQDMVGVNQYGRVVSSWSAVYQGKYKKRLEPEEFYREVGRADLAEEYASNSSQATWAGALTGVGLLGTIGGSTWWMVEGLSAGYGEEADTTVPMWLTIGSGALMITGFILAPDEMHPVSPSEARELADKHNKKLKKELGLSQEYSPMPRASRNSIDYSFGIGATPGGAAGVLRIEF